MVLVTLLFFCQADRILLGMKKRGVGAGKWNGFGGKVLSHESIEEATLRECEEEIQIKPKNIEKVATIEFHIPTKHYHTVAHVFMAEEWEGEPKETEEMKPQWFAINKIPYDHMWSDDKLWLPKILAGKKIQALFIFDNKEQVSFSKIEPLVETR